MRLKLLRDLQALPEDQLYLCHDKEVADKHKLRCPFKCGCRTWRGGGVVSVDFYSGLPELFNHSRFQDVELVLISSLEPVVGQRWYYTQRLTSTAGEG